MVYISKWEELREALARVMATGIGEDAAKRDICNALGDGNISVRIRRSSDPEWRVSKDVFIPPRLYPDDFCWFLSRWQYTNPLHRYQLGLCQDLPDGLRLWDAATIELCREDVTNALCKEGVTNTLGRRLEETPAKSKVTVRDENGAIKSLAVYLKANQDLKRSDAANWCRTQGFKLSGRGFQRVWPQARAKAGLGAKAPAGRKRTSLR